MLLTLLSGAIAGQQPPQVWIGVEIKAEKDIPSIEGTTAKSGLRITSLRFRSPGDKAGLLIEDLIIGTEGLVFPAEPADVEYQFRELIRQHMPGDALTLRVVRDRKVMDIPVVVERRPEPLPVKEYSFSKLHWPEEQFANTLIDEFNVRKSYEDLRGRLAGLSNTGDGFRLPRVAYIQREPFQLRTIAGQTFDQLSAAMNQRNPQASLHLAAAWIDAPASPLPPLKIGMTLEGHLNQLIDVLHQSRVKRAEAFAKLTPDDQRFFEENCDAVFNAFAEGVDLATDRNQERWRREAHLLELATKVDFAKLFQGADLLGRVAEDNYLDDLELALRKAWEAAGKPAGVFIDRETPVGRILVAGNGNNRYTEDAAIVLDLGGNDLYANNSGSARGGILPAALLVDFAGNDAYEATDNWTQGAARMGYSVLVDRKGNDEYIGRAWTQGAAVLGAALFLDESGSDIYRADQYAQGAAAWGIAIHIDYEGDDVYDARLLAQAVGLPGGAGWLLDGKGNDSYYSKGERPTTYRNPGISDSLSQGFGVGFRGLQSGGVAVLYDGGGKDRYEGGNFAQGGGYYFGIGMLRDAGKDNDIYIGSQYNQGFAAHQAIGFFEDLGGDDFYTTRHAVAQGISWDETITVFVDHAGNDVYEGGASYSQGASAHNGFCLFLDLGGRNEFVYTTPQGSAGPNDYHGGSSFSLFVAVDDKGNTYHSKINPPAIRLNGEYGFFADLPATIENAVNTKLWQRLTRK